MRKKHVQTEYSEIGRYLFLGTNLCCSLHGAKLRKKGFCADISLEEERVENPREMKFQLWLPVKDHHAPSMEQLFAGTAFLAELQKNKVKTYVHCKNGHGRSPSLVIAYYIFTGMTHKEALAFVSAKRPEIHLWPGQIKRLKEFSKKLNNNH